jgi:hypothetical protein
VTGEIDEQALEEKRWLLSSAVLARSRNRLLRYAGASFASTAAEYVHCLWHDVTVELVRIICPASGCANGRAAGLLVPAGRRLLLLV